MSDRLTRLRSLTAPTEDRLGRLRALTTPEITRPPAQRADATRTAPVTDERPVAEQLGESRFPWTPKEPEPEPTLLTRKPEVADASRVAPTPTPVLPQNTLTPRNPAITRDQPSLDLERASYATPGPIAGGVERALNMASGGLGRMAGGPLADALVSMRSGQP
jgi:hypothetical protein